MSEFGFSLSVDPAALPRTMTRAQWFELHHWLRTVRRRVGQELGWGRA
jgi:hypothetical protein